MENKKFLIRTIEDGRMENREMKQLYGGDIGCSSCFACYGDSCYGVEICVNVYRWCNGGNYCYCDDIANENCAGNSSYKVKTPTGQIQL